MTGIPIKFCGVGEKLDQIEVFHPERMADRILGMGDVMSLIEKATENIDETDAMDLAEKLQKGHFNYNDFLKQLSMIKKMGSLKSILGMIPGMGAQLKNMDIDDKQFDKVEAIIKSMTKEERKNPDLVSKSQSRKERIAKGCGKSYPEINALTRQFEDMRTQMKRMMGLDERQVKQMARTGMPPSGMNRPKKGKGKNKGQFRF